MLEVSVKYVALLICSFYTFIKLLRLKPGYKIFLPYILFTIIITLIIYAVREFSASLSSILMFIYLVLFTVKFTKVSLKLSMTTTVISLAISYVAFLISVAFVSVIEQSIILLFDISQLTNLIFMACTVIIQLLLVTTPFKFKRLKNGIPFMLEHGSSDVAVFISLSLLLSASFFNVNNNGELIYILPVFFILISGLIVLFWWRNSITKKYLEKIKAQEIQALQETISKNAAEVERLTQHNEELSKIIHKDNKLIPTLEYAVRQYLLTAEYETDSAARLARGRMLLSQIESISAERTGIIKTYESSNKKLLSTGVPSIDSLLAYMLQKAKEHQIDFNLSLSGSVKYLIENITTEQDINTLLADLIDNAIIATKKCAPKNILVHIGIAENSYSINIFDNGIPFSPETICSIGLKRTTTHAGEGGSGIGLMTTFEILKKYQASFVIEDLADNALYTKCVSVCFDKSGQFRMKSERATNVELFSVREDIVLVSEIGA